LNLLVLGFSMIAICLVGGVVGAAIPVAQAQEMKTQDKAAPSIATVPLTTPAPVNFQVMTIDLGCGCDRNTLTDQERLTRAKKMIEDFPADIIFVARGECVAPALAAATHRTWIALPAAAAGAGVITTWPQSSAVEGEIWKGLGVRLTASNGREVVAFAIAFPFAPYQPYQLSGVPHDEQPFLNSAEAAASSANTTRGLQSEKLAVAARAATAAGFAVIAAGMVNEPSAGDWCDQAVAAELCPMRVAWPCVVTLERAGLRDAFRAAKPQVVLSPGATWPTIMLKRDRSDRVDFIFANTRLHCDSIEILGESGAVSARNPKPLAGGLPGEHRALLAQFQWRETSSVK
jgi:hypothetical protein